MSPHPKCPVCHHSHRLGADHIYDEPAHGGTVDAPSLSLGDESCAGSSPAVPTIVLDQHPNILRMDSYTSPPAGRKPCGDPAKMVEMLVKETSSHPGLKISAAAEATIENHLEAMDIERQSIPRATFDRTVYQRIYMRYRPKAKAEGLSVIDYWKKHSIDWRQG